MSLSLAISPNRTLFWDEAAAAEQGVDPEHLARTAGRTPPQTLLFLARQDPSPELTASLSYWRDLARLYLARLCHAHPSAKSVQPPEESDLTALATEVPPMKGSEFVDAECLSKVWTELDQQAQADIQSQGGDRATYFQGTPWHQVGRVTFHLAENKQDEDRPFAFLATYTSGFAVESQSKTQHIPLGRAVHQYVNDKATLLKLLQPIQAAANQSPVVKEMVDKGHIYRPRAWSIEEAYRFLKEVPVLEQSGVLVKVPNWWKPSAPSRPKVSITVGEKKNPQVGADALLDFDVSLTLDGEKISAAEWKRIAQSTQGLAYLRGRWVEVDKTRLDQLLNHWKHLQRDSEGINFLQAMRLLSGTPIDKSDDQFNLEDSSEWTSIQSGKWLTNILEEMRNPQLQAKLDAIPGLEAQLRPYQKKGTSWLLLMHRLGLGACLADDMGLGKTIQVLAFLLHVKNSGQAKAPSLLVAPASLVANWQAEAARFTPSLKLWIAHTSNPKFSVDGKLPADVDLAVTTYGMLTRSSALLETKWLLAILDEAQAIKNPTSNQTRAVKKLQASNRVALTGTPVENSLADLWSLFDFICPGLLGSPSSFRNFTTRLTKERHHFAPLRKLTHPYILRRLKTDKSIISDLPDKTELKTYCSLSKKQTVLYGQAVNELAAKITEAEPMQRRGLILAFLMRFKQICNHPDQWIGSGAYLPAESGKFARLGELAEQISERQEKVLVFSQFQEMTNPLARFLEGVFKRPGLVLHGGTGLNQRKEMVQSFQKESGAPFFILSLKAGGVGLNLTQASHVIHFDRWWNPAVENQATDRAFRLGQKKNVLVHKFICKGTLEDKIDEMIDGKKSLAEGVLGGGGEAALTEMSNDEVMRFVSLDLNSALKE